jgi:class 3 adenylate cyclase
MTDEQPQSGRANGFLFADLRDYTRYAEAHGDQAAAELLAVYRDLVRSAISRSTGAEIRTEGDSFYIVFPSASNAIRTGLAILDAARAATAARPDRPIRVGVGIHAGETAETSEGLVGSAVNIAARVCSQAKAGELLVTDVVRGLTRTSVPYRFAPVGQKKLKGVSDPVALYRVEPLTDATAETVRAQRAFPGFRRRASTRWLVMVASTVLVALVVVVAALAYGSLANPAATPAPTFPTRAEKDLLSRLPLTVHQEGQQNCARTAATDAAPGATASVRCQLPDTVDAAYVIYDQYDNGLEMGTFVDMTQNRRHLPQGDCSTSPAAWQPWQMPNIGAGKLLCYPDEAGHAWVMWSYSSSFTLGRATRNDSDSHRLYAWWNLTAPLILR